MKPNTLIVNDEYATTAVTHEDMHYTIKRYTRCVLSSGKWTIMVEYNEADGEHQECIKHHYGLNPEAVKVCINKHPKSADKFAILSAATS